MKTTLSTFLLCLCLLPAFAQISYSERLELEMKDDYKDESVEDMGAKGFILAARSEDRQDGGYEWKYDLYDTVLQLKATQNVLLDKRLYKDQSYTSAGHLHSFYKDRKGRYSLVSISADNLELEVVEGKLPRRTEIREMVVLEDYAYFRAVVKKAPFVFAINWKTGEQKFQPVNIQGHKARKTGVTSIQVLEDSKEIMLVVEALQSRKKSDTHLIFLNRKAEKVATFKLQKNDERNFVQVSATKFRNSSYILTGSYSSKGTSTSEGLFFAELKDGKLQYLEYYNYLDLENFLSYLPERTQERIERRKKRKASRGKEMITNYRIAAHDLIEIEDGYIFLGEAYYPTYRSETYTTTTVSNGIPTTTTSTRTVFDGYRYTHAVVVRFNTHGELVWDEIFKMYPRQKPYRVKKFISVPTQDLNSMSMMYASGGNIFAKTIDFDGNVVHNEETEEIATPNAADKTRGSYSNLSYWYGNHFLAYGYQKIKNKEAESRKDRKRKVFFVNKVTYGKGPTVKL